MHLIGSEVWLVTALTEPSWQVFDIPRLALTQSTPLAVIRLVPRSVQAEILADMQDGGVDEKYEYALLVCCARTTVVDGKQQICWTRLERTLCKISISIIKFWAELLKTVLREKSCEGVAEVVRISVQGGERVKVAGWMAVNLSVMAEALGMMKELVAGNVLAVISSFDVLFRTKMLTLWMLLMRQVLVIICGSISSRQGRGVKVEWLFRQYRAGSEQEVLGKEEVSLGLGGVAVSREVQSCGFQLKQWQVLTS